MNTALEISWEQFIHSPSRKDGVSEHVERFLRADTCKFIDEFGKDYHLGGKIRLLACSLFHTFYLRVSFHAISRWETAVACLIIAAKIENKVQTVKKITRSAAHYLRPERKQIQPQQLYHWMSQIHIRERQIIERLYGELRTSLPIQSLKLEELRLITFDEHNKMLNPKNKHLSNIFHGCFAVLCKLFRSVLCIYYPPPWLAAVAVFKALRIYNNDRINQEKKPPKLYLKYEWFKLFDPTKRLSLNTIQYISDEIDASDDKVISVKDYTSIPYELCGIKTLAFTKRISLLRTKPFHQLPIQIQNDLRNAFKLRKTEFIDLRCAKIKKLEQENMEIKPQNTNNNMDIDSHNLLSAPNTNIYINDASLEWIHGEAPTHDQSLKDLMEQQKKLLKGTEPNRNLEEGEIEDDEDVHYNRKHNRKRKRREMNSSKNFETKTNLRLKCNIKQELFHCGLEKYKYVQRRSDNVMPMDEDSDMYYMNWCVQRFDYDEYGNCIKQQPQIKKNKAFAKDKFMYRIPTPNYNIMSGITPSPMTPGYGISPMTPGYGTTPQRVVNEEDAYWKRSYNKQANEDLNDSVSFINNDIIMNNNDNNANTHSFITKTKRNNYLSEPPHKKMKNHHRK